MKKKLSKYGIISIFLFLLVSIGIATSYYVIYYNDAGDALLSFNFTDEYTEFFMLNNDSKILIGKEFITFSDLNNNTIFFNKRLEYINLSDENFQIIRWHENENITIKEIYQFNRSNKLKELFPVFHTIETYNYLNDFIFLNYKVDNLKYNGNDKTNLNHLIIVGNNVSVEWINEIPDSEWLYSNGTLDLTFKVNLGYDSFNIRMFDPITGITFSPVLTERSHMHSRLPLNFTITNTSTIDSCWFTVNGGITNYTIPCSNLAINYIWDDINNVTLYVNDTDNNVASQSTNFYSTGVLYLNAGSGVRPAINGVSYKDKLYLIYSQNIITHYFVEYNVNKNVITSLSSNLPSGIPTNWTPYTLAVDKVNDLIWIGGNSSYLVSFNITSNASINYSDVLRAKIDVGHTMIIDYDDVNNLVWFASRQNNKFGFFNISSGTVTNLSSSIPPFTLILNLKYEKEHNSIFIVGTGGPGIINYNITDGTYKNISIGTLVNSNLAQDNINNITYYCGTAGSVSTCYYYNWTGETSVPIVASNNAYTFLSAQTISIFPNSIGINPINNITFFSGSGAGRIPVILKYDKNNNIGETLDKTFYYGVSTSSYPFNLFIYNENISQMYGIIYYSDSNGFIYVINETLNNTQNNISTKLTFNESYTNSVVPFDITPTFASRVSDIWYSINDGENVSLKWASGNILSNIQSKLWNYNLTATIKYNFTLYTNTSYYNNITMLDFRNISISNTYNMNFTIPNNWLSGAVSFMFEDPNGRIWFGTNNAILAYYDINQRKIIDMTKNGDLLYLNTTYYYDGTYDPIRNGVWITTFNNGLFYYNYTTGLFTNMSSLLTPFASGTGGYKITVDRYFTDQIFVATGSIAGTYSINLTDSTMVKRHVAGDSCNGVNTFTWINFSGNPHYIISGGCTTAVPMLHNITTNYTVKLANAPIALSYTSTGDIGTFIPERNLLVGSAAGGVYYIVNTSTMTAIPGVSGSDINNYIAGAYTGKVTAGTELDGDIFLTYGQGSIYDWSTKNTTPLSATVLYPLLPTMINYSMCQYSSYDNKLYCFGAISTGGVSLAGKFAVFDHTHLNTSFPFITMPTENQTYYSIDTPIMINVHGRQPNSCWYNLNDGPNVTFNCEEAINMNLTIPERIVGINNFSVSVLDKYGITVTNNKSFKAFNYTNISYSGLSTYDCYTSTYSPSSTNFYLFCGNGLFFKNNLTSGAVTSLSSTDTGNWLGTSAVTDSCLHPNGGIYFIAAAGKFGYYNETSNVATALTSNIQSQFGLAATLTSIKCTPTGEILISQRDGKIAMFYPNNNTYVNLTINTNSVSDITAIDYLPGYNLLGFVNSYVINRGAVYGYINLSSPTYAITYLNSTTPIIPNRNFQGRFKNIASNNIDTFYFGGVESIMAHNVTSNLTTNLLNFNSTNSGLLSGGGTVEPYDSFYYDNTSNNRLFFSSNITSQGYMNLTNNKIYYFESPFGTIHSYGTRYRSYMVNTVNDTLIYFIMPEGTNVPHLIKIKTNELIDEYPGGEPPIDVCSYTGGNWVVQCASCPVLDEIYNLNGYNITFNGTAEDLVSVTGKIFNYDKLSIYKCNLRINTGDARI